MNEIGDFIVNLADVNRIKRIVTRVYVQIMPIIFANLFEMENLLKHNISIKTKDNPSIYIFDSKI
jgi:hypothetical protein